MKKEIIEILERHQIHDWEISEFQFPTEHWKVLLKTFEKNDAVIKKIEDFLNRKAIAFGMQGPFIVVWEKLEKR